MLSLALTQFTKQAASNSYKTCMTKYVVNSGGLHNVPDKKGPFFNEMVRNLGSKPKVLLCFFALSREEWKDKFAEDLSDFKTIFTGEIQPRLEMVMPDIFGKQMRESDAVYIHGGDDYLVQYWLKKFDLPRLWEGKVVATNSASSNAISKHFWTPDWRKCMDGLGILPIKFLPHYKSNYGAGDPRGPIDWDKGYKELENYGDKNLPIYALEEGEFEIFEQ